MHKLLKLLPFILLGLVATTNSSCSESDPEESCKVSQTDIGTCSADDISVCCDEDGACYYTYKGTDYDDVDDIAGVCQPQASAAELKSLTIQMDALTQQLINEARTAAACN